MESELRVPNFILLYYTRLGTTRLVFRETCGVQCGANYLQTKEDRQREERDRQSLKEV